ncbi:MAG TPA: hypothetical protein VFL41_01245 [Gaiellaceae bacterium]|nr:hypothetical protein [Gaiellaceae bacterium]
MLSRLKRLLAQLGGGSLQRGDHASESKQSVENTDAMAAGGLRDVDPSGQLGGYSFPPNYVPPADEGRPRH